MTILLLFATNERNLKSYIAMSPKNKKQLIIQAAIEVFSKSDFKNSRITEIAQRANVSEGTIYQYFRNKEDLFFSIPIEKTKEFDEQVALHLQGVDGALNKLKKYVWYDLYFFENNPHYARILFLEMRVQKKFIKTKTYKWIKKTTRQVLDIIKEGQKENVIRKDVNVYLLRHLVLGILEHVITRWLLKDRKYSLIEDFQEISNLIINGIKAET